MGLRISGVMRTPTQQAVLGVQNYMELQVENELQAYGHFFIKNTMTPYELQVMLVSSTSACDGKCVLFRPMWFLPLTAMSLQDSGIIIGVGERNPSAKSGASYTTHLEVAVGRGFRSSLGKRRVPFTPAGSSLCELQNTYRDTAKWISDVTLGQEGCYWHDHQVIKENNAESVLMALQKLQPFGTPEIYISSRTDSGVHALCNSAHVDIERRPGNQPFSEAILVKALNYHLKPEYIKVLKAIRVNNDFHARHDVLSRTYVYRLVTGYRYSDLPVFERNLCWAATENLDVAKIQEAAQIMVGTHDFSAFRSLNSETPFKSPIKTLEQADFTASSSLLPIHSHSSDVQFWNVTFKSRSFIYKQVRRMTSALVAVGLGLLTPEQIRFHLETGEQMAFSRNVIAPPDGLFLKEVKYADTNLNMDKAPS
ncbi:PREDICTED: tRNA pseudouridine synthase-like 1 [Nanorana parkeri]|uniref:tRNA pseudouridine synthase-like 1 n=1 Tax=Nanorana parkeri TaxID=125878 RepID=UPI000854E6CF|nr:PREDICTED: tRNA pseudouridine synthase-like 1 [Nanorana parkeri]